MPSPLFPTAGALMSACTPLCMCLIQAAIYLGREHRHMVRGSEVADLGHLLQPMVSQNTRHTVPLCHRSMQDIIYIPYHISCPCYLCLAGIQLQNITTYSLCTATGIIILPWKLPVLSFGHSPCGPAAKETLANTC